MQKLKNAGQATLEYILLTVLVVGVVTVAFKKPLGGLVTKYTSRKDRYTTVVKQKTLGIPSTWFGGTYAPPTGAGADNAGNSSDAGDSSSAPSSVAGADNAGGNNAGGNNAGGANAGGANAGGVNGGGANAGGANAGGANAGGTTSPLQTELGANTGGNGNKSGRKNGASGAGDDDEGGDINGGTGGRRGGPNGEFKDGSVSKDADAAKTPEEEAAQKQKTKEAKEAAELAKQKALYGSSAIRIGQGGCENLDLKALIKIAFIVALLFILISMLLQKKGDDK